MLGFLRHLFLPHSSNNHRPRVLHHSSLLIFTLFFLTSAIIVSSISRSRPDVLGITANVSTDDLLSITNQKRAENGLQPLSISTELTNAANAKGQDMLAKNYWAHNSPDGITPWVFIKNAGYEYIYAGENLARGYNVASDVIDAWMSSPGHRGNMLSPNYKEIGFAVLSGKLMDDDTVLVVEEFGSRNLAGVPKDIVVSSEENTSITKPTIVTSSEPKGVVAILSLTPTPTQGIVALEENTDLVAAVKSEPLINKKSLTRNIPILVISFFILILLLDMFVIERNKIDRLVGHNIDHVIFLTIILVAIIFVSRGLIL